MIAALDGVRTILDHIEYKMESTKTTPDTDTCINPEPIALAHAPRTGADAAGRGTSRQTPRLSRFTDAAESQNSRVAASLISDSDESGRPSTNGDTTVSMSISVRPKLRAAAPCDAYDGWPSVVPVPQHLDAFERVCVTECDVPQHESAFGTHPGPPVRWADEDS
jgi:hypothetical protein